MKIAGCFFSIAIGLPGGQAYSWYQAIMIVEVSKEQPFETFKQAVKNAGKPLQ